MISAAARWHVHHNEGQSERLQQKSIIERRESGVLGGGLNLFLQWHARKDDVASVIHASDSEDSDSAGQREKEVR